MMSKLEISDIETNVIITSRLLKTKVPILHFLLYFIIQKIRFSHGFLLQRYAQ